MIQFRTNKIITTTLLGLGLLTIFLSLNRFVEAQSAQDVPIDICLTVESWNRPSANQHLATLKKRPDRYRPQSGNWNVYLTDEHWTSDLIIFSDYYGLSGLGWVNARTGAWYLPIEAHERKGNCTEKWANIGSASEAENPKSEFWLFKHRMKKIQWTGKEYIITVEPKGRGFQLGYFDKQSKNIYSYKVINTKGQVLARCDGDTGSCKFSRPK
ncbi:MAG: hypothetical protein IM477_15015 [Microcystis sp. M090S1]|jgi:hypothetical protein|uniref:hypothetical protein n=1 Tax=Microcystis sp. M090S1 TaxID=2771135 RepID=UPI00258AE4B5|nr:hypothetical protein [Microcystis sp. M090S1]MCA2813774.1 hypothetical protein [Microcystis sp. M090S1]